MLGTHDLGTHSRGVLSSVDVFHIRPKRISKGRTALFSRKASFRWIVSSILAHRGCPRGTSMDSKLDSKLSLYFRYQVLNAQEYSPSGSPSNSFYSFRSMPQTAILTRGIEGGVGAQALASSSVQCLEPSAAPEATGGRSRDPSGEALAKQHQISTRRYQLL